jgi:hypothetical protein
MPFLPSLNIAAVNSHPLVVLPLLLELAVLGRAAYTREPTHIILGAVAVPCLMVSIWAAMESLNPSGGVYWGGLFSMAAGGLLTFLVVADAVAGVVARKRTAGQRRTAEQ